MCSLKLYKPDTMNNDTNTLKWLQRSTSSPYWCKVAALATALQCIQHMDTVKNVVCNADIWKNTKILFFK